MGIIKISPGLWCIDAAVRINGKHKRKRRKFRGTKTEANEKWGELKNEIRLSAPNKRSLKVLGIKIFGECLDRYIESNTGKWEAYRVKELKEGLGNVPFGELAEKFDRYVQITKNRPTKRGTPPRPATINKLITLAKAATRYCYRLGLIKQDPLRAIQKLNEMNIRDRVISPTEFQRLHNLLPDDLKPLVQFAYSIPTRKGELTKIRKEDVDIINKRILLRAENTKTKRARTLPIPESMIDYFNRLPPDCEWAFYRKKKIGGGFLHLQIGRFEKSWKTACKESGIGAGFRFHDLRRVAASNLARKGVSESVIKYLGGWRTDIFFIRYRQIEVEELIRAVNGKDTEKTLEVSTKCQQVSTF